MTLLEPVELPLRCLELLDYGMLPDGNSHSIASIWAKMTSRDAMKLRGRQFLFARSRLIVLLHDN